MSPNNQISCRRSSKVLVTDDGMIYCMSVDYYRQSGDNEMKAGVILLVLGLILLFLSIPYSIVTMVFGLMQLQSGAVSTGISSYFGIIGVVVGFIMTAIGVVKVFKR